MKKAILMVILAVLVVAGVCIGYELLHAVANELRGHNGVGGEIAVFFLPIIIWMVYRNIKDMREVG